ncbi:MAG: hypothetical protein LWY06_00010 [Firmicutes bacterium]|nr:hypothetical protein [Bacillota bacterium]
MKKLMIFAALIVFMITAARAETVDFKQMDMTFQLPSGFKKVREVANNNTAQLMFSVGGLGGGGRSITITGYNRRYSDPAEVAKMDIENRKKDPLFQKITPIKINGAGAATFYTYNPKKAAPMLFQISIYTKLHYIGIECGSTPEDSAAFEKVIVNMLKSINMR